jgi:hypothetical protein
MKETICALIKDDIHHTMLMQRLEAAGFNTLDYTLSLSDAIFALLGLDNSSSIDELAKGYFDLVKKYNQSGDGNLEEFTDIIYAYLEGFQTSSMILKIGVNFALKTPSG